MNWKTSTGLALALAVAMAMPAAAQDRLFDWSGFYVGGGAGVTSGGVITTFGPGAGGFGPFGGGMWAPDTTGGSFSNGTAGGLYGAHAGFLQQWDRLVGGVEVSFDLSDVQGTTTNAFPGILRTTTYNNQLKWLATLTPRLGYAWNQLLVYGKGGVAMGRLESTLGADGNACFVGQPCSFHGEAIHVGFTAGVGLDYALTPDWVLGLEYDYYDLGVANYGGHTTPNTGWNTAYALQPRFSALRARVAYRFGAPPAATAEAAPPTAGPDPNTRWQGFYLGANLGYGWASHGYNFAPGGSGNGGSGPALGLFAPDAAGGFFATHGTGGVYGLHAGFDRQWDRLVGGVELTVALSDINAQASNPFGAQTDPNASYATNVKWLATLAPRVGWAWDQFLVYGKAGLAVARLSSNLNSTSIAGCSAGGFGTASTCAFGEERNHLGVVVGAGFEYQFTRNWSVGFEYNYMDLSTETYGGTISPNTTWPLAYTVHPQISTVRGRLSYRL